MSNQVEPVGNGAPVISGVSAPAAPATPPPAPAAQAADPGQVAELTQQQKAAVEAAVEEANRALESAAPSIRLSLDGETNQVVVRLIDQNTGSVIRQIPSEEDLAIAARLRDLVGVFFNQQI
ncbi:MAG: flagellar protein FlaG [Nitrospirota bacterium]